MSDLLQRLQRLPNVFRRHEVALIVTRNRHGVVRLEHGDALVDVALCQPNRVFKLPLVVLVLTVTPNGVVDPDFVPAHAAKQIVDWLAHGLTSDIPKRDVDGGQRAELSARVAEAFRNGEHLRPEALAVDWVLAN